MAGWECPTCDEQFHGIGGFDQHRVWTCDHKAHREECWDTRRCLTPAEMAGIGMPKKRGVWLEAPPQEAIQTPHRGQETTQKSEAGVA